VVVFEGTTSTGSCGSAGSIVLIPVANCAIYPSAASTWPYNMSYLLAHEVTHLLGAVPTCAPHYVSGHVSDDNRDVLYSGPGGRDWDNLALDPGNDDYFRHSNGACPDIDDSPLLGIG
jgi:hypothetical protein